LYSIVSVRKIECGWVLVRYAIEAKQK